MTKFYLAFKIHKALPHFSFFILKMNIPFEHYCNIFYFLQIYSYNNNLSFHLSLTIFILSSCIFVLANIFWTMYFSVFLSVVLYDLSALFLVSFESIPFYPVCFFLGPVCLFLFFYPFCYFLFSLSFPLAFFPFIYVLFFFFCLCFHLLLLPTNFLLFSVLPISLHSQYLSISFSECLFR